MQGPRVEEGDFVERYGIRAVEGAVLDARCIWRETPLRDVGIDGQIEHRLSSGVATGRLVAVQVKSGLSYFARSDGSNILYTPSAKHHAYWERHPLPVVLILHDEDRGRTIWADARSQLRHGATVVRVPLDAVFDRTGVLGALTLDGPLPSERRPVHEVAREMAHNRHPDRGFRVSYLDLFLGGLTDVGHSLYFGMDLAHETQDVLAALPGGNGMIGIGDREFAFLDTYIAYLVTHDLVRVDFDAWRRMSERFHMVGSFVAPLTARGEELLAHLQVTYPDLAEAGLMRERLVALRMDDMDTRVALQVELAHRLAPAPAPAPAPSADAPPTAG